MKESSSVYNNSSTHTLIGKIHFREQTCQIPCLLLFVDINKDKIDFENMTLKN